MLCHAVVRAASSVCSIWAVCPLLVSSVHGPITKWWCRTTVRPCRCEVSIPDGHETTQICSSRSRRRKSAWLKFNGVQAAWQASVYWRALSPWGYSQELLRPPRLLARTSIRWCRDSFCRHPIAKITILQRWHESTARGFRRARSAITPTPRLRSVGSWGTIRASVTCASNIAMGIVVQHDELRLAYWIAGIHGVPLLRQAKRKAPSCDQPGASISICV